MPSLLAALALASALLPLPRAAAEDFVAMSSRALGAQTLEERASLLARAVAAWTPRYGRTSLARAYLRLSESLLALNRPAPALEAAQAAHALRPADKEPRVLLARIQIQRHHYQHAVSYLRAALRSAPEDPDVHGNLCAALKLLGRTLSASRHCRKAVALEPEVAEHYLNRAYLRIELGQFEDASADLDRAERIWKEDGRSLDLYAREGRAHLTLRRGDPTGAREGFDAVLARSPKLAWALWGRAQAWREIRVSSAAAADVDAALALDPLFVEAFDLRGAMRCGGPVSVEGLPDLDRSIAICPTPSALAHRAECLLRSGKPEAALRDAEALADYMERRAEALALGARARAALGAGRR